MPPHAFDALDGSRSTVRAGLRRPAPSWLATTNAGVARCVSRTVRRLTSLASRQGRGRRAALPSTLFGPKLALERLESRELLAADLPFDPVLRLEATDGVVVDGVTGAVAEWADQSVGGNNVFAEAGEQPELVANLTPSGLSALRFDGRDDRLLRTLEDGPLTALPAGNAGRSVFLVAQFHDSAAFGGAAYGRFGINRAFSVGVAGPGADEGQLLLRSWGPGNDLVSSTPGYSPGSGSAGWVLLSAVHVNDGSNPADNDFLYADGGLIASRDSVLNTRTNVGSQFNGASKSRIVIGEEIRELGHIEFDVAAYLVFDEALADADRTQVEQYLTDKYLEPQQQVNVPPTAGDDSAEVDRSASVLIDVLANDSDSDGTLDPATVTIVGQPLNGSVAVDAQTGVVTYTNDGSGAADSFTYTVQDDAGATSNVASVAITINNVGGNQPPVAVDDSVSVTDGESAVLDVLANDSDPDGSIDPSTVEIITPPQRAAAYSVDPQTGAVNYTHDGSGLPDSFTYRVYDDDGAASNTAEVSIGVLPSAPPPVAVDDAATLDDGGETIIPLLANDTGVAIDPATITIVDAPQNALSLSIDPENGVVTYEHDGSGEGDSFTYTVAGVDGKVSNTATVTLSLTAANARPVALGDQVILADGGSTSIDLLANDLDADGSVDPTSVTLVEAPRQAAAFSIDPATGVASYTHNGSGNPDRFVYAVRDDLGRYSGLATVTIAMQDEARSLVGFSDQVVFSGLNLPLATETLPDGRILILEKGGVIKIGDPSTGATETYLTLTNIDFGGERGLLDITLSPGFDPASPGNNHIYLYYTPANPRRARIARFTHQENSGGLTSTADPASELELWRDTHGYITCCHYGGGLDFGPDGKIWLTTSDKFTAPNPGEGNRTDNFPQDLTAGGGKVIRINPDGTIPDGTDGTPANPFIDPVDDDPDLPGDQDYLDSIWAYGLRNPFRASWDIESGRFFIGEVGGNVQTESYEDVHIATLDAPGVNYGWPNHEGPDYLAFGTPIEHAQPIFSYAHNGVGASLTGGEVYRGDQFPEEWDGVYFYGDFTRDFIRYLTFDSDGNVSGDFPFRPSDAFPGIAPQIVDIAVGDDGSLYYTLISGNVRRVTFSSANQAPSIDSLEADPTSGVSPLVVDFTAAVSDPNNDDLTFVWTFGDGSTASGDVVDGLVSISHAYAVDGLYEAFLEVSDGQSTVFSDFVPVQVGQVNLAPEVTAFSATPDEGDSPLIVLFNATITDADSPSLTYELVFGDGQSTGFLPAPASGVIQAEHAYQQDGQFQARLRVSDGVNTVETNTLPIVAGETELPPVTTGLVTLLESNIKLSVSQGTTVAAWLDGSGRGNNLDAFGDPQVVFDATPSGLPAVVFDGDGDKLERPGVAELNELPSGNDDRTVFVVADYVDTQGFDVGVAYGEGGPNRAFGLISDSAGNLAVQGWGVGNDFSSGVLAEGEGWLVHSAVLDDSLLTQYRDGGLIRADDHTFATDTVGGPARFVIGQEIAGLGFAEMSVAAVLIYDRALDESERLSVESYLQQKYLVGNLLPVAADDTAAVDNGDSVVIDILANDNDIDGVLNPATVTIVDAPQQGTLSIDPGTGAVTYSHTGEIQLDTFSYTVDDEVGNTSNVAVVTVTVLDPDPGPDSLITAGLVGYFDAAAGVSTNGSGTVLAWLDSSGNGNDLQSPGGAPLLAQGATPSGLDAIEFTPNDFLAREGSTDALNNLPSGSEDRTLFFVANYTNSSTIGGFIYGDGGAGRSFGLGVRPGGELSVIGGNFGSTEVSDVNAFGAGWIVQSVVLSDDEFRHFNGDELIDSGTRVYNTQLDRLVFGQGPFGSGWVRMSVAAGLIYDRALTDAERLQTEAFLRERYLGPADVTNDPPVAIDDSASADLGGSVAIDVLANDTDTDGLLEPSSVMIVSQPQNGTAVVDPLTGVVTYTNNGSGTIDSFTYTVEDNDGDVSDVATVSLSILGDPSPGENSLVVRWHGDYYQHLWDGSVPGGTPRDRLENRWLRGGPIEGKLFSTQDLDLDGDSQQDDSLVWLDFSLQEKLNPPGSPRRPPDGVFYHEDLPSAVFYGGLSAQFFNYETARIQQAFIENDGAGGALDDVGYPSPYTAPEFQGLQDFVESVRNDDGRYRKTHVGPHEDFAINLYRPELPHPIDPSDDPSDNLVSFQAAFVWRKEDFLAGGADQTVSLDADSTFSFESTRWWDSIGGARWIIQDGDGQLYISEFNLPGGFDIYGQTNRFSDPLGSRWSVYTPSGSDLAFDSSTAAWVDPVQQGLFTDIQAFGLYLESDGPSGDLTRFSLDEIQFNAVVGEAAPPASALASSSSAAPLGLIATSPAPSRAAVDNGPTAGPGADGAGAGSSAEELLLHLAAADSHALFEELFDSGVMADELLAEVDGRPSADLEDQLELDAAVFDGYLL